MMLQASTNNTSITFGGGLSWLTVVFIYLVDAGTSMYTSMNETTAVTSRLKLFLKNCKTTNKS